MVTLRVAAALFAAATALGGMNASPAPDERPPFLVAFNAETGETRWRVSVGERPGYLSIQDALRDVVYGVRIRCGIDLNPSFVAFDADSGKERWQVPVSEDMDDVGVGKSAVVVVDRHDALRGLDPKNGVDRWERDLEGFAPTGGNRELVLVWRSDGLVRAIDRRSGRTRWEYPFSGTGGNPVADDDTVVMIVGPPRTTAPTNPVFTVHVLDASIGAPKNQFDVPYLPDGIDVSGSVVAIETAGMVNGYDAATGELLWTMSGGLARQSSSRNGLLVLSPAPGDTSNPEYTLLDASTGKTVIPRLYKNQVSGFDLDNQTVAIKENEPQSEGLRTHVRALEPSTGTERWKRTVGSYADLAVGRDAVYAAGGCETAP